MSEYRVELIPLTMITWPEQERKQFDPVAMAALAETIRLHGVEQPIGVVVEGDHFSGLWGQRRWLASKAAGRDTIPAIVREAPQSEAEAIELRLVENVARENLNAIELGEGLTELMKCGGYSATAAAARVGLSSPQVCKTLQLLSLPKWIQDKVRIGEIPAASGYLLAQIDDPTEQSETATKVASGEITRDQVAAAVNRKKTATANVSTAKSSRISAVLGGGRSISLSGPDLESLDAMIHWLDELSALAKKERRNGIELKTFAKMLKDKASQPATKVAVAG